MKKTKITEIPHFPTRYYDNDAGGWVYVPDSLSHADYAGQIEWSHERTPDGRTIQLKPTMVPNLPFDDTLTYDDYYRGRSAAGAVFKNSKGERFTVFMTDLSKFIPLMVEGVISGKFIFCKRGMNYGVTLYDTLPANRSLAIDRAKQKLVVALDKATVEDARALVDELGSLVEIYKIGLELVLGGDGLRFARDLQSRSKKKIFLDMKLLDIPNTVEKAVANVAAMGFDFLTVHGHDTKTLVAAVAGRNAGDNRPKTEQLKLLAVTVLTSYSQHDLVMDHGVRETPLELAVKRAKMACIAGFDGVIASGHEAKAIREATISMNPNFIIMVPGIRPSGAMVGDQNRIMTPKMALKAGADYLVVGRPISEATDKIIATQRILDEIASA